MENLGKWIAVSACILGGSVLAATDHNGWGWLMLLAVLFAGV